MINDLLRQFGVRLLLLRDRCTERDRGVTAVEYALIVAIMVVIIVAAFAVLTPAIQNAFNRARDAING